MNSVLAAQELFEAPLLSFGRKFIEREFAFSKANATLDNFLAHMNTSLLKHYRRYKLRPASPR